MNLNDLLKLNSKNMQNDSRQIQEGDVFVAYPGAVADGRLFIEKAIAKGAAAVIYEVENWPEGVLLPQSVPCLPVSHLSNQLGELAQSFYSNPGQHMVLSGVTGTNGKTSIAYQLAQAHALLGQKAAYVGTIGQGQVNALQALDNTTPDALHLQRLLHEYHTQKIRHVCMEVSSHALVQHRVDALDFKQAIFTNLSLDHLDYHLNMQDYAKAKALLFAKDSLEWAIVNQDDSYTALMLNALKPGVKKLTYGLKKGADVWAAHWEMDTHGTCIQVQSPWGEHEVFIQALGQFNIYNSLAIMSSLLAHHYDPKKIVDVLAQLKAAPGRMEVVSNAPYVVVDYAHTPDALEKALVTLGQLKKGKLWVVFGCGGDRDKSKRPIMGKVASLHADCVVITSDNPRTEDPSTILTDIAQGLTPSYTALQFVAREEAISYALKGACAEDIVLIAGKGHEAYQQIGQVKYPFSDQEVVKRLMAEKV